MKTINHPCISLVLTLFFIGFVTMGFAQADPDLPTAVGAINRKLKTIPSAKGLKQNEPVATVSNYKTLGYYQDATSENGRFYVEKYHMNAFYIAGVMKEKYDERRAEQGGLGFLKADVSNKRSGVSKVFCLYAEFEGGAIVKPAGIDKKTSVIGGAIFQRWKDWGDVEGEMGYALTDWQSFLGRKDQYFQTFEGGVFWTNTQNVYYLSNKVAKSFNVGTMGMPVEDEKGNSFLNMSSVKCQKGVLVYEKSTGIHFIKNNIADKWYAVNEGKNFSVTGFPTSDEIKTPGIIFQCFQKGIFTVVGDEVRYFGDDTNKVNNDKMRQQIRIPGKK